MASVPQPRYPLLATLTMTRAAHRDNIDNADHLMSANAVPTTPTQRSRDLVSTALERWESDGGRIPRQRTRN